MQLDGIKHIGGGSFIGSVGFDPKVAERISLVGYRMSTISGIGRHHYFYLHNTSRPFVGPMGIANATPIKLTMKREAPKQPRASCDYYYQYIESIYKPKQQE